MAMTWEQSLDICERREQMRQQSREEAESMMKLAGFTISHTWELRNGYWPDAPDYDDVRTPWWLFQTPLGLIEIGRRKRVFKIDWSASPFRGIITMDDVTKTKQSVHAWTTSKAVEYLSELRVQAAAAAKGETIRETRP